MSVTICANGLSIVHKGSGGEATSSVPDVCLTTVGKPVVPIPYTNSAKSADLVDGTTTVVADGGNSIAIEGSKFSCSVGDGGGDKKGVASGTIEDEAEFITSSGTVVIEGKGVARLSDHMTMNKANTICTGVANPSVTVTEEEEGTYTVNVKARYPDGLLLKDADFEITDASGASLGASRFSASGEGSVSGLKPGQIKIIVQESSNDFEPKVIRKENPHYWEEINNDDFFHLAARGQQTFWQPIRIESALNMWGMMGKSLTADRYFTDIAKLEAKTHFEKHHPDFTFGPLAEALVAGIESMSEESMNRVLSAGLPPAIEEGEILSVLMRLPKHETTDRMLAYMRARGKGNPQTYLQQYDWAKTQKTLVLELESILKKIKGRVEFLQEEASRLGYDFLADDIYSPHITTINTYLKKLPDNLGLAFDRLKAQSEKLMSDTSNVSVIQAPDGVSSAEARNIDVVVNAIQEIDVEEQQWVKIRAIHDDLWETPLYVQNLKITVDDSVVHKEGIAVSESPVRSTESETIELANETQHIEGGVVLIDDLKPNASTVEVEIVGEPGIEQQISDTQNSIEATLDGAYNALVEDMQGFQQQWDEEGYLTLGDGVIAGAKSWGRIW